MATPEHTPMGRGYSEWVGYYQHANDYWSKRMPIESTGEVQ
jgi:arylsulfatase I/J